MLERILCTAALALTLAAAPCAAQTPPAAMLDSLQHASFNFFWYEANPVNGLIKDRSASWSPCSIASTGFGLSAICVGIDHGWITREEGADRVERTLQTFWRGPQGTAASGVIGYKGLFYHFLDMSTATRTWDCELSSIDTALLLAGILDARQYFDGAGDTEVHIRQLADSINQRVDWQWMMGGTQSLKMGWRPDTGFSTFGLWYGYNEAMIMYILALGSPTFPIPTNAWNNWLSGYDFDTQYGYSYVVFPPLFGHQYSHCWIDYRGLTDIYWRLLPTYQPLAYGLDYFQNSRRATLAQQAYCIDNPGGWVGYGELLWGLTACDGPPGAGYKARGAPPAQNDDGTIAPTAVGGSIVFAPEICIPTLQFMWDNIPGLRHPYGLRDAFNPTVGWYGPDVIGIDQGPFVLMIENLLTESVWDRCMQIPEIQQGLAQAGFQQGGVGVEGPGPRATAMELSQNDPNPFRGTTTIRYRLAQAGPVRLHVYDARGRLVARLVDGMQPAGEHAQRFETAGLPSGVYHYRLEAGGQSLVRKCVHLRP